MLKGSVRSYLKKLGHDLKPVIIVGKNGLTDSVVKSIDEALKAHELIKIKFGECKEQKKEFTDTISESLSCEVISRIGNISMLYRQNENPEDRKIRIPLLKK